jgi:hypothetical protein
MESDRVHTEFERALGKLTTKKPELKELRRRKATVEAAGRKVSVR